MSTAKNDFMVSHYRIVCHGNCHPAISCARSPFFPPLRPTCPTVVGGYETKRLSPERLCEDESAEKSGWGGDVCPLGGDGFPAGGGKNPTPLPSMGCMVTMSTKIMGNVEKLQFMSFREGVK